MKHVPKYKVELSILIPIFIFLCVSIISIYSTKRLLPAEYSKLWSKQIIWYVIGITLAYSLMILGNKFLYVSLKSFIIRDKVIIKNIFINSLGWIVPIKGILNQQVALLTVTPNGRTSANKIIPTR